MILKTLERRGAVQDSDFQNIAALKEMAKDKLQEILDDMTKNRDIMFLEYIHEEFPNTVKTIYFPNDTLVYPLNQSVKGRFVSDEIKRFFKLLIRKNLLEKDVYDELDRDGIVKYYEALKSLNLPLDCMQRSNILSILK